MVRFPLKRTRQDTGLNVKVKFSYSPNLLPFPNSSIPMKPRGWILVLLPPKGYKYVCAISGGQVNSLCKFTTSFVSFSSFLTFLKIQNHFKEYPRLSKNASNFPEFFWVVSMPLLVTLGDNGTYLHTLLLTSPLCLY